MAELRFNPLTEDWVMIASHRQNRPQMPKDWCPFCPGSGKVPDSYEVLAYDNDFPALSQNPPKEDDVASDFFKTAPSYGKCEVILYSPEHTTTLKSLSHEHIMKLVSLWQERFTAISSDEKIKFVFIFENKGEAVGVTMPHPHGQIYGYSFVPKKIQLELNSFSKLKEQSGECLICKMKSEEEKDGRRIIFKNDSFTVFLPFFCEYPYGVYIVPNRHFSYITQMTDKEKSDFALTLKQTAGMLDCLFDMRFPYMMCMYNAPVNMGDMSDYHFHIAFYPPMRSKDKIKFNASSETGAWAHCNPVAPEAASEQLRAAYQKFVDFQE